MADQGGDEDDRDRPTAPAGRRWGRGAWSVLPFLAKALQSRPSASGDSREARNSALRHSNFADSTRPGSIG